VLSSYSVVSSSRTVRPYSPWGGRWIGQWRTTWSTVCSSAPHPQAAEEAILQEAETPDTGAQAVKPDPGSSWKGHSGEVGAGVGDENAKSCGVVRLLRIPLVLRPVRRTYVVFVRWTDELLCDGYKWVSRVDEPSHASALDGQVSAEWSRSPGSMARHARDNVASLRRSSAGWMPAQIGRLFAGVGRRHPVTNRKVSLMARSMRRAWALRHQTGAQYSAVECTRIRMAVRRVVAPALQPEPGSHLRSATRDVSFLRSNSRCRRYFSDLSNVTPRYLGSEQKGRVS